MFQANVLITKMTKASVCLHPGVKATLNKLRSHPKSISSQIAEFGCNGGGGGFITNLLRVMEWNLTMFSIIFCKVSTMDNIKQRQEWPKRFPLLTVEGF